MGDSPINCLNVERLVTEFFQTARSRHDMLLLEHHRGTGNPMGPMGDLRPVKAFSAAEQLFKVQAAGVEECTLQIAIKPLERCGVGFYRGTDATPQVDNFPQLVNPQWFDQQAIDTGISFIADT